MIEGFWPADDLRRAFVAGAKWWEFHSTGATMWRSDCDLAEAAAERRYPGGAIRPTTAAPNTACTCSETVGVYPTEEPNCPVHGMWQPPRG